jgi:hypothetical protein
LLTFTSIWLLGKVSLNYNLCMYLIRQFCFFIRNIFGSWLNKGNSAKILVGGFWNVKLVNVSFSFPFLFGFFFPLILVRFLIELVRKKKEQKREDVRSGLIAISIEICRKINNLTACLWCDFPFFFLLKNIFENKLNFLIFFKLIF